jgi:aminomuconate-semialdehyde/2-hydroxymuconate-6-semialdehyde dehydrogenase
MTIIQNFINGEFVSAVSGKTLNNVNPAKNESIGTLPDSDAQDIHNAVAAAKAAFKTWGKTSAAERAAYLYRIADLIDEQTDELALAESTDQGKPLWLAKSMDIPRAAANFRFFAGAILHDEAAFHQTTPNLYNYSLRQPVGVAGLISPWNLPLYLLTWKIAPALAAGNTCVAKPSEVTPLTAFKLCEIFQQAALPNGVANLVHGLGTNVGDALTTHEDVPIISFTGGTSTGKLVYRNAVEKFKKVSLELGGKNPTIIFNDADYTKALKTTIRSAFTNQGEICLCGSRIYVQEDLYDRFLTDFVNEAKKLEVGDPLAEKTNLGAIVSQDHFNKILSYIDLAKTEGGKIETGGKSVKLNGDHANGFFIEPTIISGLKNNCRVIQEEIFGPVVTVLPFKTIEDAIGLANESSYGLSSNIWTSNLKTAQQVSAEVDAGIIWVNTWMPRDLRTPFGGMRQSGVGREGGRYSLDFFTKVKNICIDFNE